jgi:hypothetical protein
MGLGSRYILPFIFFLIPLTYSIDNDPYRAWEVLFWGGFTMLLVLINFAHLRSVPEFFLIIVYAAVLMLQQYLIPDGQLWFGAQYALVFAAAVLPSLVISWISWSIDDFNRCWDAAIKALSVVFLVSILGSLLLGWGESHIGGLAGGRYFGYLGDSISPVIVFPLIYFFLEKRYGWVILMLGMMLLTGGKAAALLLAAVPFFMLLLRLRPLVQFIVISAITLTALLLDASFSDLMRAITNDPFLSYSANTRTLSIEVGLEYFKDSPIWGIGINQSMLEISSDSDTMASRAGIIEYWPVEQIHNPFIRALAETGVIGFSVLVGLCVLLIRRAFSALRVATGSAPSRCRSIVIAGGIWTVLFIVFYQTTGWFEHGHPQFAWLLTIAAISSVAARQLATVPRHPRLARFARGGFAKSGVMLQQANARSANR